MPNEGLLIFYANEAIKIEAGLSKSVWLLDTV
jgi:hypothetical protein